MKNKTQIFILLLIIVSFTACRYDEGPMISFRSVEKRVAKHFLLVEFTKNGVAITQELTDSCGNYWSFLTFAQSVGSQNFRVTGSVYSHENISMGETWSLQSDKKHIVIKCIYVHEGLEPFQNNIITTWKIERLTKEEMWLSCTYNNSDYYIKLEEDED